MRRTIAMLDRLAGRLARAAETSLVILVATFSSLALIQVILRYGFNRAVFWADEVTLFAFTWTIFLSAALALERKMHFGVYLVVERFPHPLRRGTAIAVQVAMLGVVGFFLWFGVENSWANWIQVSDVLRIPMTWWYLSLPAASLIMVVSLLRDLCILLSGGELAQPQEELV